MKNASGETLLLSLFVGGLWTVGFVVVPMLFSTIEDKALAGTVAAKLFHVCGLVAAICAGLTLLLGSLRLKTAYWAGLGSKSLALSFGLLLLNLLWLQPEIAAARDAGMAAEEFKVLHQRASLVYTAVAVLAVAALLFYPKGVLRVVATDSGPQ